MNNLEEVAHIIWQIREEIGIPGYDKMDWFYAERFLEYWGCTDYVYEDIYKWLMENNYELEADYIESLKEQEN
jgi:hypothetical protein